MGRVTMRQAIAAYLQEANLTYVGLIYPSRPQVVDEQAYEANRFGEAVPSQHGSSAVLVINLPGDQRRRRADTGRGAVNDSRVHKAVVEVWFASVGGQADAAQEDYDEVVDSIIAVIRQNATLNAPATVWSAGEYDSGVEHQQSLPRVGADGTTVFISGTVRFDAWEWIAGTA